MGRREGLTSPASLSTADGAEVVDAFNEGGWRGACEESVLPDCFDGAFDGVGVNVPELCSTEGLPVQVGESDCTVDVGVGVSVCICLGFDDTVAVDCDGIGEVNCCDEFV